MLEALNYHKKVVLQKKNELKSLTQVNFFHIYFAIFNFSSFKPVERAFYS